MNQEDAYRAYDCVRKEFPDYANFEGGPWIETKTGWARSNGGYLMEVTRGEVKVSGPSFERMWSVNKLEMKDFYLDREMTVSLTGPLPGCLRLPRCAASMQELCSYCASRKLSEAPIG
jgi:hypothetical protein